MRKRYSIIFTITAAAVLASSVAYASKKKLQAKSEKLKTDISEVDFAAKLLDAGDLQKQKPPIPRDANKINDDALKELTMVDKPKI
jgi:hypothetical protein